MSRTFSLTRILSSVLPRTYSITMKNVLSSFSAAIIRTMFGMVEGGLETRLLEELEQLLGLLVGDLDRDLDVEPGVLGQEDRTEPAAPEGADDLVFADLLALEEHVTSSRNGTGSRRRSGRRSRPGGPAVPGSPARSRGPRSPPPPRRSIRPSGPTSTATASGPEADSASGASPRRSRSGRPPCSLRTSFIAAGGSARKADRVRGGWIRRPSPSRDCLDASQRDLLPALDSSARLFPRASRPTGRRRRAGIRRGPSSAAFWTTKSMALALSTDWARTIRVRRVSPGVRDRQDERRRGRP